jgi:thiamine-monophosphate kinase
MPARIAGVPITRIGSLSPQSRKKPLITLRHADGDMTAVEPAGWEHFTS